MKFIELKNNLKSKIDTVYLLEGNDRYVLYSAIELIQRQINLAFPDLNQKVFSETKFSLEDVIEAARVFPFGDEKRLLFVWDYSLAKDVSILENFIKDGLDYSIIVFVSNQPNEFTKKIKTLASFVDCNKLDDVTLNKWIINYVNKNNCKITESAILCLINYCNSNLVKINSELQKLVSLGADVIDNDMIINYVTPDKEFQIYELTDAIAKGNGERVFDIIQSMLVQDKNVIGLIQYLYSSFRKLFYISISSDSDEVLSQKFKCKPYAIKMSRLQAKLFTPKQLKKINKELSDLDYNIKSGKANQNIAIDYIICKILSNK